MPLSAAERQKRYREKMKNENPDKFKEMQRRNAERTNKTRKRIGDFGPDEREELRRKWRENKKKKKDVEEYLNENSLTGTDNTFQHNADNSDVEDVKYFTTHVDILPSVSPESQTVKRPSISNYAQPSYDTLEIDKRPKIENREDDLDSFGKYVTSSLRTLSAKDCVHAQDEIQSILSKYKMRNINKRRNSTRRKPESCSSDSDEQ